MAQPIWSLGCPTQKRGKNAFFVCLPLFWAYVWQPDDHISLATSMLFGSIYPTHPRTNPWNHCKKILKFGRAENDIFWFLVFGYWVFQKKIFVCFFPMEISLAFIWGIIYFCSMDGFFRILEKTTSKLICTRLSK